MKRFAQTALLGVPMFARGAPIGAVLLARTEPDCPFGGEEVDRAVAMVNQLATAIANARLFDLAQASDRLAGASWRQGPADSGVALARPLWLNGSRMKKRDLDVIRQSLQRARAQALSSSPTRIEPNRKDETQVGVADEDAQALSEMLQVLSSQRNKGQKELVARIDRAMRRLESAPDDFGLCEDCEEDIPRKRLQLVPYATLCAACQSKRDPVRGAARKKITDYQ